MTCRKKRRSGSLRGHVVFMSDVASTQGARRTLCGIWQSPAVPAGSALRLPRPMPGSIVREGQCTVQRTHASYVTSHCACNLPRMTVNPAPRGWPSSRYSFAYERSSPNGPDAISILPNNQGGKRWFVQAHGSANCTASKLAGQRYTTQQYCSLQWCAMQGWCGGISTDPKSHRTLNAVQRLALMGFPPAALSLTRSMGSLLGSQPFALRFAVQSERLPTPAADVLYRVFQRIRSVDGV